MAQPLTYQQLLAQQYDESARDRLVFQSTEREDEYDEDAKYDTQFSNTRGVGYELEDQHAYGKFAGNRNLEDDLVKAKEFEDKSKFSVRYNKDVKLNIFSIDSRFRAYAYPGLSSVPQPLPSILPDNLSNISSTALSTASHFIFRCSKQIKNAMSIKLTSMEIPNIFYNFLASRGNTSFRIREFTTSETKNTWYAVTIPDGYYQTPELLAAAVQTALRALEDLLNHSTFTCSLQNSFIKISNTETTTYDFDFSTSPFTYNADETTTVVQTQIFETLGDMLGFVVSQNLDDSTYYNKTLNTVPLIGSYSLDVNPDNYLYLKINDYSTIIPQSINDTYYTVFARIPVNVTKGVTIVDNPSINGTTKEYKFLQPTNIHQLEIQLLDMSGAEIVFKGNFSMTLEIEEVVSHSLYEKLREL